MKAPNRMRVFKDLSKRDVRVRILTNSLESTPELLAHSGCMACRVPVLADGMKLDEVRSLPGNARGSAESSAVAGSGHYALHAKLLVFDRQKLYVASMNFDQRSHNLHTGIGLIIDSPELARQAARFESIVAPANSHALALPAIRRADCQS
jgi:cardiolipin synthase C